MRRDERNLLTIDALVDSPGTRHVRVSERLNVSSAAIAERIRAGTYDEPLIIDNGKTRTLLFKLDGSIQSEMRLDDPTALVDAYTREMMAFLLFCPQPRQIVMIGLGGGSLAKFCCSRLPRTCFLTVVEIEEAVIGLSQHFGVPDDTRLRIIHADGGQYVAAMANSAERTDVLLVDAYDRQGLSESVVTLDFFMNAKIALGATGIFVMNLAAFECDGPSTLRLIRTVFGRAVISVIVGWGGNMVVFAGAPLNDPAVMNSVQARSREVRRDLGLHFKKLPGLVKRLDGTFT